MAKASHAVLICQMEQGEIKDYTQADKIDRIRRANAQRHLPYTNNSQQHSIAKNSMSRLQKVCHASFSTKAPVSIKKLMRHVVLCTSIYAPRVSLLGGNNFLIRK